MAPEPQPRPHLPHNISSSTKVSLRSHSSSFEADDERSSSADQESMGPERPESPLGRHTAAQYPGEDTRLTSRKELAGWYAYGFAAEVFIICGMGSFIPMTLEQLARENGVLLSDRSRPCESSSNPSSPVMTLMSRLAGPRAAVQDDGQCIITVLGMEINSASFAMYTFSISVLIQSLLVISISCAADHGNYRKRLLLTFAFVGATATMLFITALPSVYLLGALYAIIANTCSGASFVLLNSFLPLLVRHHPETQHAAEAASSSDLRESHFRDTPADTETVLTNSTAALLPDSNVSLSRTSTSIELQLSTQISAKGIGIAYSAGLFLQCASIIVILLLKSSTFSLRLVLFLVGLWWFVFTIPAAMWLRPRPGPPLPKHPSSVGVATSVSKTRTWLGYIGHSWLSLYRTIIFARRLTDIVLFLASWFLLSDAIATVSGVSILFAKTHLHMSPPTLALISVLATTSGILGAFTWPLISRFFRLKPIHTILCCIALFEIIPLYGLLDYLPFIHSLGFFGLQQPWEMYPVGILYGFVLGGLSSYCRSLYGELIPPGSEAAFYALYAITDKGSSIFGPAIVGIIVDRTGGIRPAFWFLMLLIGLPAPLIAFVDVGRGRREGRALAGVIEGFRASREAGSGFVSAVPSGTASITDVGVGPEESQGLLTGPHEDGDLVH